MPEPSAQPTDVRGGAAKTLQTQKVLAFTLDDKMYAVDVAQAKEVLDAPCITKVPFMPDFVKGVINLRGEILSVLDIRPFCGLPSRRRTDPVKVIVTDVAGPAVGVLADQVKGTLEISPDQVQSPLSTLDERIGRHVVGQARLKIGIVVILDLRSILQSEPVDRLRQVVG